MSITTILPEVNLEFAYDGNYNAYAAHGVGMGIFLAEAEIYRVIWRGNTFECTSFSIQIGDRLIYVIGNPAAVGGEDNEMPFLIACDPAYGGLAVFNLMDADPCNVSITQGEERAVIVRDYAGREVKYTGVEQIALETNEGDQEFFTKGALIKGVSTPVDFSNGDMLLRLPDGYLANEATIRKPENLVPENIKKGEVVAGIEGELVGNPEEIEVELNFSEGDQVVTPSTEDKLISKATIKKPGNLIPGNVKKGEFIAGVEGDFNGNSEEVEVNIDFSNGDHEILPTTEDVLISKAIIKRPHNLIPENVKKGEIIAGIEGTHECGDGDFVKTPTEVAGYYVADSEGKVVIKHDLGLMPDIIMITATSASSAYFLSIFGFCEDLVAPSEVARQRVLVYGSVNWITINGTIPVEQEDPEGFGYISKAGPETFEVGGSLLKHIVGTKYDYKVLGGLIKRSGYFRIELQLDGAGNLIVTKGVAAIETLDIYLDGVYAKTVAYMHGDSVEIDISDVASEFKVYTVSVIAAGSLIEENYPYRYYKPVTGWVAPNTEDAVAYGTCGTDVRWKLEQDGVLIIAGFGAMNGLTAGAQPWFAYKDKITSVRVLSGVTSIGANFVREHTNIISVEIADTVKTIGSSSFRSCTGITSVVIPDSVTLIDYYAFRDCLGLESVVIGNGVTTIELYAFHTCSALKTVTMGNNVQTINYRAFQACAELTSIVIPATLTLMGDNVFYGCNKLTSATFKDTTTWKVYTSQTATSGTTISSSNLANTSTAATYLRSTYVGRWWKKT